MITVTKRVFRITVSSRGPQGIRGPAGSPGPEGPRGPTGPAGGVITVAGRDGVVTLSKADVGLSNVDNTSDTDKPVSAAQATADASVATAASNALSSHVSDPDPHTGYQKETEKGQANGYASLDGDGKVPAGQLPPSGSIGGTLGSVANTLARTSGTGGSTLQGSGVTLDDNAVMLATNWTVGHAVYSGRTFAKFCAVGSNIALVIGPTGTGYISAQNPDGTTAGGNQRGDNAVDLSFGRSSAARVASGAGSFAGGQDAQAANTGAFSWRATVTSIAGVGFGLGTVSGQFGFHAGAFNTVSGQSGGAIGEGHANSGQGGFCSNLYNVVTSLAGSATGYTSVASLYGQWSHASGRYSANGDCQSSLMELRRVTTDATPANLFLDGSSARLVVPANSSGTALVSVIAKTATAGGDQMHWDRLVRWRRGVTPGSVDIDVVTIGTDRGFTGGAWGSGPPWAMTITADTVNGGWAPVGTGAPATNIRWGSSVRWMEISFP